MSIPVPRSGDHDATGTGPAVPGRVPAPRASTVDGGSRASTVDDAPVPAVVRDIELGEPLPALSGYDGRGRRAARAWLLVRLFTEPLGALVLDLPERGLSQVEVARAVQARFGPLIGARVDRAGGRTGTAVAVTGIEVPGTPPYLAQRAEVLALAPPITVVVCTRERPDDLARCLAGLLAQAYPRMRILVVDNAPRTSATADLVRALGPAAPVRYLCAPRPGLSHARNAAVRAARGEILAFTDDDVVPDRYWLAEIARSLHEHPRADVIAGLAVPAELDTPAQLWFEQFGGHSKGRGFTPAVFGPHTRHAQSPLYPLPAFGVGANMTFRPGVIERIGMFDPALGAGTPAAGSEDTLAFTQVLLAGGTIAYTPRALVRHRHRRDTAGLRAQLVGYGTGLAAMYTSLLLSRPRLLPALLALVPTALRGLLAADPLRADDLGADLPRSLVRAGRLGMLRGPGAYLRGRRRSRR